VAEQLNNKMPSCEDTVRIISCCSSLDVEAPVVAVSGHHISRSSVAWSSTAMT
jgi:hypothetical protein